MFTLLYLPTAIILLTIMSWFDGIVDTFKENYPCFLGVLLFCIAMDCIHLYYYKKNANNLFF
jgi:hypothetical protein